MKKSILFAVIILVIGFAIGMLNNESSMIWYETLNKPPLTPPNWAFPVAWSILYVMLGFVFADLISLKPRDNKVIWLFILQLILNFMWSPAFFVAQNPLAALVIIALLVGFLTSLLYNSFYKSRKSFYLLLPYFLWVLFATYLNLYIVINN